MRSKKFVLAAAAAAAALLFSGCSLFSSQGYRNAIWDYDFSNMELVQLEEPEEGHQAAIIQTSMGDMTAVLYPEYAPNAVSNFVNRANEGYYDNIKIFQNYEKLFMMTGSKSENGSSGVTDDGQLIENEYSPNLWPFKGAICACSTTMGYCDSRFFFCNTYEEFTEQNIEDFHSITKDDKQLLPDELIDAWIEYGSIPNVSGFYPVIGQIVEGMDVLDKMIEAEYNKETYVPFDDIIIYHIEITEYHKPVE